MRSVFVQLVNLNGTLLLPSHELHVANKDTILYLKLTVQVQLSNFTDGATFKTMRVFPWLVHETRDFSPRNELLDELPLLGMELDAQHPLIVQIPTTRRVSDWNLEAMEHDNEPCPQLQITYTGDPVIRIPASYFPDHPYRLGRKPKDQVLYRSTAVEADWRAIQKHAIDASNTILSIAGAPGSGKSCAAFAFACGLVDHTVFDVVWIHFDHGYLRCVKFVGEAKWTCTIPDIEDWPVMKAQLLRVSAPSRATIVFLDGYNDDPDLCDDMNEYEDLVAWRNEDPDLRRLVRVNNTIRHGPDYPSRYDGDHDGDATSSDSTTTTRKVAFTMPSWTLDECKAAVENDALFAHVADALREPSDPDPLPLDLSLEQRKQRVTHKFDASGGNPRRMFYYTVDQARKCVDLAYRLPFRFELLVAIDVDAKGTPHKRLISRYAGIQLALRLLPHEVVSIAAMKDVVRDACLFEAWFWSSILDYRTEKYSPTLLQGDLKNGPVTFLTWPSDTNLLNKDPFLEQWVRIRFEDGYDSVFMDPKLKLVCFLRLVHDADQIRPIDVERCALLLTRLQQTKWWHVERVEFCYVLPSDLCLDGYSVPWEEPASGELVVNRRKIPIETKCFLVDYPRVESSAVQVHDDCSSDSQSDFEE